LDAYRRTALGRPTGVAEKFFGDDALQAALTDAKTDRRIFQQFNELFVVVEILAKSERQTSERTAKRSGQAKMAVMMADEGSSRQHRRNVAVDYE